jgi:hypothetical protein
MRTWELIEIDPATGEEDHLIATGTFAQMSAEMSSIIEEVVGDYDAEGAHYWSWMRVQPAA